MVNVLMIFFLCIDKLHNVYFINMELYGFGVQVLRLAIYHYIDINKCISINISH